MAVKQSIWGLLGKGSSEMFEEYKEHDVAVYGGYLEDDTKLLQSSSGGIATALTEFMLEQGGYVAGVAYTEDFYGAEYIIIHDKEDVWKLKGSKYIECDKKNICADVKALLEAGEKVLFFGLPCMVAALYKVLGERHENILTCELICHGPVDAKVHSDYIAYLEKKHKSKVMEFSVRHKKDTWKPGYLYARFENGEIFEKPFYETEYGFAFSTIGKKSCYACKFKGNDRQGDLMIGDFWGATEKDKYWNPRGVSCIFAETEKGNDFVKATPGIKLFPTTFGKVVKRNTMVIRSKQPKRIGERVAGLLQKRGLFYAVKHADTYKTKIKKTISKFIPECMKPMAKKIYHGIKKICG